MTPELHRPVRLDQISTAGIEITVTPSAAERAALARRFGVLDVGRLDAKVELKALRGGSLIRLRGSFEAEVVQACVVTLEPVPASLRESFEMTFSPEAGNEEEDADVEFGFDDEDPPDPVVGGVIDVGEAVAEHLALALDPFPRKAGACVPGALSEPPPEDEKPHPFAKLAQWRQKNE